MRRLLTLLIAFAIAAAYFVFRRKERAYLAAVENSSHDAADKVEAATDDLTTAASGVKEAVAETVDELEDLAGPH
jgi:hypothetical protein